MSSGTTDENTSISKLSQRSRWLTQQTFTMLEDKLVYRSRGIGKSVELSIPYNQLNPNPQRYRHVAFVAMAIGVLSLAATILFFVKASHDRPRDADGEYVAAFLIGIVFLSCVATAWQRTFDIIVFQSSLGRIVIRNGRPDRETCQQFVRLLQEKISSHTSIERRVVVGVLRVLRAEDFLDEWKYRKARERFDVANDGENG